MLIFSDEPDLNLEGDRRYVGYDSVAEQYATYLHPEELAAQIYAGYGKAIAGLAGHGNLLLDVACGPGLYDIEIAKRGCKVIASNISIKRYLERLRHSGLARGLRLIVLECRAGPRDFAPTHRGGRATRTAPGELRLGSSRCPGVPGIGKPAGRRRRTD